MEKLFVYGTLKNPEIQKYVFGRIADMKPANLEGYKKSIIKISRNSYPIIIPYKKSSVKGFVISVSKKEIKLIDTYETNAYRRKKVMLKDGILAWVYMK